MKPCTQRPSASYRLPRPSGGEISASIEPTAAPGMSYTSTAMAAPGVGSSPQSTPAGTRRQAYAGRPGMAEVHQRGIGRAGRDEGDAERQADVGEPGQQRQRAPAEQVDEVGVAGLGYRLRSVLTSMVADAAQVRPAIGGPDPTTSAGRRVATVRSFDGADRAGTPRSTPIRWVPTPCCSISRTTTLALAETGRSNAGQAAMVGRPSTSMLSLTANGTPNSGIARSAAERSACGDARASSAATWASSAAAPVSVIQASGGLSVNSRWRKAYSSCRGDVPSA